MIEAQAVSVREASGADLPRVEAIERLCFPAHPWDQDALAKYECLVAVTDAGVVGFLSYRTLVRPGEDGDGEFEILNLAVDPEWRRQGVAKTLLRHQLARGGEHFLEVRASNKAARKLYEHMDFRVIGTRSEYYSNPKESAIVMKWKWC
jgi:[ribosomal protein S18]-alanine N-acetyltransferase